MLVSLVSLRNFMSHDAYELALPPVGIVVITGANGAGKSAIVEGVAAAVWGKSLRGASCWRQEVDSEAGAVFGAEAHHVVRSRKAKGKLALSTPAHLGEFDTPSKAQEALEAQVGTFEEWRRTHVFSSADVGHFTTASDAERKALLERLVGAVGRFDSALAACQERIKAADALVVAADRAQGVAAARLDTYRKNLDRELNQDEEAPPALPKTPLEELEPRLVVAEQRTALASKDAHESASLSAYEENRSAAAEADSELRVLQSKLQAAQRKEARASLGRCSECEQPISAEAHAEAKAAMEALQLVCDAADVRAAKARVKLDREVQERTKNVAEAQAYLGRMQREQHELQEAVRQARDMVVDRARWQERVDARAKHLDHLRREVAAAQLEAFDAEDELAARKAERDVLKAAGEALGLRGARVHVLAEALKGVQDVANYWLANLFSHQMWCELSLGEESRERGQRVGSVALTVHGLPHDVDSYRNLSGGQRRRLDVAMTFALAEVSSLASGREAGTLFVDEAFDALDAAGVQAVCKCLEEVAKERCVVVITHNPEFVEKLNWDSLRQVGQVP